MPLLRYCMSMSSYRIASWRLTTKVPWICFSTFAPTLFGPEIWTRATFSWKGSDRSIVSRYFHLSVRFLSHLAVLSRGAEPGWREEEALHLQTRPQIDGDFTFLHFHISSLLLHCESVSLHGPSTPQLIRELRVDEVEDWGWWLVGEGQEFFLHLKVIL